jgi:hypothetical protein
MPFMGRRVTKPVSPLEGGTSLEIIPLHVQTFIIHVQITIVVSQHVEGSERFNNKHDEHVNPTYTILDNRLESLEFLSTSILLTPHQIGIGQEVTLISNTPHVSKVFTTP